MTSIIRGNCDGDFPFSYKIEDIEGFKTFKVSSTKFQTIDFSLNSKKVDPTWGVDFARARLKIKIPQYIQTTQYEKDDEKQQMRDLVLAHGAVALRIALLAIPLIVVFALSLQPQVWLLAPLLFAAGAGTFALEKTVVHFLAKRDGIDLNDVPISLYKQFWGGPIYAYFSDRNDLIYQEHTILRQFIGNDLLALANSEVAATRSSAAPSSLSDQQGSQHSIPESN